MTTEKPIVIVSVGRSGSTYLHDLLTRSPNAAWLSGLANKFPNTPQPHRLVLRLASSPAVVSRTTRRRFPASEHYRFWDEHAPGFSEPCRDLAADDLTPRVARRLNAAFNPIKSGMRNRLILKVTGWPRIGYLNALLPEAVFIHIVRDPRAVVNSLLDSPWWDGWKGPDSWRYGPLSAEDAQEWWSHDRSFAALAALQWRVHTNAAERSLFQLGSERSTTIKYEDLCAEPTRTIGHVASVAQLPWDPHQLDRAVRDSVRRPTKSWSVDLSPRQISAIESVTVEGRDRYAYD